MHVVCYDQCVEHLRARMYEGAPLKRWMWRLGRQQGAVWGKLCIRWYWFVILWHCSPCTSRLVRDALSPCPVTQLRAWLREVEEAGSEGAEYMRMCLSTVNSNGIPSSRMVLLVSAFVLSTFAIATSP